MVNVAFEGILASDHVVLGWLGVRVLVCLGIWVLGLLGCLGYAGPRYNPRPRTLGRSVVSVLQHLACGRRWCSLTVGATAALRVEVSSSLSVSSDCRADAIYTVVAAAVAAVAAAR